MQQSVDHRRESDDTRVGKELPRIFCMGKNARAIFQQLGYPAARDIHPREADILWIRKNVRHYMDRLGPLQAINHLPDEYVLNNKGALAEAARENPEWADFHPESYCLYRYDQMKAFLSRPRNGIWIAKPCSSSRGIGIKLFRPAEHNPTLRFDGHNYIVQKYIENPFLLNGRKSSIRTYWLIAGLDPLIAYIYPEGSVKLCTRPYSNGDLALTAAHLTNSFQNRDMVNYAPAANKLSWDQFLAHVPGLDKVTLVSRMGAALGAVADYAFCSRVRPPRKGRCFALLAADWVLDDKNRLWLTEIQQNFGMRFDDPLKKRLMPDLFNDAIGIIHATMRRPGTDPDSTGKFIRIR